MSAPSALLLIVLTLALGAFSSTLFVWQWVIGPPTQLSASILLIAVIAVFVKLFLYLKRQVPQSPSRPTRSWIFRRLPAASAAIAVACTGFSLIQHVKKFPHGAWDAWAIWNAHARFLYRGSASAWRDMFGPAVSGSQVDYPLLLPGLVSGAWTVMGGERPWVPAVLAIVFAALALGILWSAVSALTSDQRGPVAGFLLLATPGFLLTVSFQMADIPIGLYILTTVVLLQFAEAWPKVKRPMLVLAGLSAGFAAWTKNEGLLFIVAIFASQFASLALVRGWRELRTNWLMIGLGLSPILVLVLSFKALLATANNPVQTLGYVTSAQRYQEILFGFIDQAKGFGGVWNTVGIHPVILVAVFLLLYGQPLRNVRSASLSQLLLIVLMLAGYFMVYLLSSFTSVRGYVLGSVGRLYLQLWPASLFILATVYEPRGDHGLDFNSHPKGTAVS